MSHFVADIGVSKGRPALQRVGFQDPIEAEYSDAATSGFGFGGGGRILAWWSGVGFGKVLL